MSRLLRYSDDYRIIELYPSFITIVDNIYKKLCKAVKVPRALIVAVYANFTTGEPTIAIYITDKKEKAQNINMYYANQLELMIKTTLGAIDTMKRKFKDE